MASVSAYKQSILQSAAAATGDGTSMDVSGYNTIVFNVTGTLTNLTVTFEGSVDGSNWDTLQVSDISNGDTSTTTTATGLFRAVTSGLNHVRARVSSYTSGNVTVTAMATVGGGAGGGSGSPGTGASSTQVQGAAADNAAAVGNPVLMGGEYNASAPTYDDGDAATIQTDVNGNTKTREQYAPGYEDNTNNKAIVEHKYTASALLTADAQVKASAGLVHSVTFSCDDAAPTAGSFSLWDNTAESGTEVFSHTFTTTPFMPFTLVLDEVFATGIYAGFTTTADVNVNISYR